MKTRILILFLVLPLILIAGESGFVTEVDTSFHAYKYVPSGFNNLRIYQVMVESFRDGDSTRNYNAGYGTSHHKGDLRGIIEALPYIKSLNVNAIWLTPIFDSDKGTPRVDPYQDPDVKLDATGYYARNYFKIDPNFGTLADARELVDKAHELELYVFFDGVFGHHKGNVVESPQGNTPVGPNYHVKYPESLEFYKEVATYWIDELNIDGWRLDQAYQIPVEYLREIQKAVRRKCAERKAAGHQWGTLGYVVGEIFDVYQQIQEKGYGTEENPGLVSNFNFPLRYRIVQCLAGEEKGLRIPDCSVLFEGMETHRVYPDFAVPNLMLTNHDLVRFGDLIQRNGLENPSHENYWKRHKLAFSFMAAYTGPITLYYGDEIGEELEGFVEKVDDPEEKCWERGICDDHVSRTSGRIDNFTEQEQDLKDFVARLMAFRSDNQSLYNGRTLNLIAENDLYADLKIFGNEKILFVMNIGQEKEWLRIPADALDCETLDEAFNNRTIETVNGMFKIPVEYLSSNFYLCR